MRRRNLIGMSLVVVAALGALVAGAAAPAAEHKDRDRSISVNFDEGKPLTDCSQVKITFGSGNLYLRAQNGPISVELTGTQWQGSLDVHGTNGPLELDLPEGYRSGVRVESRGYSPFSCSAAACAAARKDWDDRNRSVQFGSAPPVVRLSTVNGPVSIGSRRSKASL